MTGVAAAVLPSLVLGASLALLLPLVSQTSIVARRGMVALALLLGLRYFAWRIAHTLPIDGSLVELAVAAIYLVLEALAYLGMAVCLLSFTRYRDNGPAADRHEQRLRRRNDSPAADTPVGDVPAVDVLIPTYDEAWEVLERSVLGARAMDYPRFTVWVLDDTGRDWVRRRCAALGVRYLSRDRRDFAKAGNLNHGLRISAAATNAPVIMVLDADFVPRREFLYRTVGFLDSRVALVQTPQFFFNPNVIQHNLGIARVWVDDLRFFFDTLQPSKDAFDSCLCCGTSFVVRRDALQQIGGFPTECITEDFLLGFKLMAAGYATRYLGEELSRGLAPESIAELVRQRSRWAVGNVQGLFLAAGPFGRNRLSLFRRLTFLDSVNYWLIMPLFWLAFLTAPLLRYYLGLRLIDATALDFVSRFLPGYLSATAVFVWCSRGRWLPILSDVTEILAAPEVAVAVWRRPLARGARPFHVTAKGVRADHTHVSWPTFVGAALLLLLTLRALIGMGFERSFGPAGGLGLLGFWMVWNSILLSLVMMVAIERPRSRTEERFTVREPARLAIDGRVEVAELRELAMSGARLRVATASRFTYGAAVRLWIDGCGEIDGRIVRRADDEICLALTPEGATREALFVKLYTGALASTARQPHPSAILRGIAWRLLSASALRRGPPEVERDRGTPGGGNSDRIITARDIRPRRELSR